VVVLLRDAHGVLGSSEARVVLVMLGCTIALLVTVVVASAEKLAITWRVRRRASHA
jgi:hypothetical protein